MKRYKSILSACLGALLPILAGSCDSFLDDQPRGNAIAETTDNYNGMFNTAQFMNLGLSDYARWLSDDLQLTEQCISDFPSTVNGYGGGYEPLSVERAFRYEKDIYESTENCTAWEMCYKNVYTFNVIANGVMGSQGGTDAEKKALRAEARISRAWMHFLLAQMFSKPYNESYAETELTIPVVTEANSTATDFERATMKQLYDFITTEMEESCPELEDRTEHNMRVYRTTGYALLGKTYWIMGEYEKALEPLRTAYQRAKQDNATIHLMDYTTLTAKYGNRELTANEIYSEMGTTADYLLPYTYANPEILWVKQDATLSGIFNYSFYGLTVYYLNPELYALFGENDMRRNLIPTHDLNGDPAPYPVGCIRDQSANYGVDLAEVYLALAECEARVGSESSARTVLEEFRSTRLLSPDAAIPASVQSKDDLIRFCLDEERREFAGRIHRWYNLRRLWNDPLFQDAKPITHNDGTTDYTLQEDDLYLRLPESVLKWNESWR